MDGGQFVVFVATDAGTGCLLAVPSDPSLEVAPHYDLVTPKEGSDFTEKHPRLHYGWQTTKEYRQRFGFLDYMWRRTPKDSYSRDGGKVIKLPRELEKRCSFLLYPYVAGRFVDVWSPHKKAIEQLRKGASHPDRELVLELARLAEANNEAFNADYWGLTTGERELTTGHIGQRDVPDDLPFKVKRFLEDQYSRRSGVTAAFRPLQEKELAKIRRALAALDHWLLDN